MKKTIIISVILLSAASLSFGQYGRQGGDFQGMNNAPSYNNMKNAPGYGGTAVAEIVELKGKVTLTEDSFPTMKSGKEELSLLMGPSAVETLKIKSGDIVSVKGLKVPGPNWSVDENSAVKVREITVNGKTYQVMGGRGMHGRSSGRNNMNKSGGRNFSGPKGNR